MTGMALQIGAIRTADRMQKPERNKSLDFTKGLLFTGMLLYRVAAFFIPRESIRLSLTCENLYLIGGSRVFNTS